MPCLHSCTQMWKYNITHLRHECFDILVSHESAQSQGPKLHTWKFFQAWPSTCPVPSQLCTGSTLFQSKGRTSSTTVQQRVTKLPFGSCLSATAIAQLDNAPAKRQTVRPIVRRGCHYFSRLTSFCKNQIKHQTRNSKSSTEKQEPHYPVGLLSSKSFASRTL